MKKNGPKKVRSKKDLVQKIMVQENLGPKKFWSPSPQNFGYINLGKMIWQ